MKTLMMASIIALSATTNAFAGLEKQELEKRKGEFTVQLCTPLIEDYKPEGASRSYTMPRAENISFDLEALELDEVINIDFKGARYSLNLKANITSYNNRFSIEAQVVNVYDDSVQDSLSLSFGGGDALYLNSHLSNLNCFEQATKLQMPVVKLGVSISK